MSNDWAVQVSELKKQYKDAWTPALDGLTMSIPKGIIYGLLGPNGAGKTTTISILCGLVKPDSGSACMMGMNCLSQQPLLRSKFGLVPQHYALFGNLTARQNLDYIGALYGIEKKELQERGSYLLNRMGLIEHQDKRVSKFSGGMRRRANIIASLLHEPELIILDEPTAGVDVQSRALILDFLLEQKQAGKTIIYTSHLLDEAERICDEIAIIDAGKLIVSGITTEVIAATSGADDLESVFLTYTGYKLRD